MSVFLEWVDPYKWWIVGLSAATFFGSLITIPVLVVRMPADYFLVRNPPPESWRSRHVVARWTLLIVKNALGIALVGAGIVLSIPGIPGQGILTVLIGLSLLSFPGKRQLELRLARQRPVLRAINWMRARAGRPPLRLPPRQRNERGSSPDP